MPDINGIPYVESGDLVAGYPAVSQSLAQEVSDQLASKLPYSFGTATPTTTDSGFLWYDSNSTPAAPKFWDGAAFQALTSGKILQIVRATDSTQRSTTSATFVDASISVTITPQKSDSAILVIWSFLSRVDASPAGTRAADYQITDSSNNALSGAEKGQFHDTSSGTSMRSSQFLMGYSTPATTSATTYKGRFAKAGGTTALCENQEQTGQLYAIEVSA